MIKVTPEIRKSKVRERQIRQNELIALVDSIPRAFRRVEATAKCYKTFTTFYPLLAVSGPNSFMAEEHCHVVREAARKTGDEDMIHAVRLLEIKYPELRQYQ